MTAEVAVLNRIGVALAADSAVTIGNAADKIYTSADKLFQLSGVAPVGVMVYGNATLSGVPWETVIKAYRCRLDDTKYSALEEYATGLMSFLTNNFDLFPSALQERQVGFLIHSFLVGLRDELEQAIDKKAKENPDGLIDEEAIPPLIDNMFAEWLEFLRTATKEIDGLPNEHRTKVLANFHAIIQERRQQVFGTLPIAEDGCAKLDSIIVELLVRDFFGPLKGGIVIAGFGEREFAPALIAYELEEIVLGEVRRKETNKYRIDENSSACIIPFAQKDPVDHFLQGIDGTLENLMRKTTGDVVLGTFNLLIKKLEEVVPEVAAQIRDAVKPEINDMLKKLFEEWKDQKIMNWKPVVDTVASLPKDELAAISEALVNLTKFRRRVTPERETVGGPIDVAVITKGDGFVWIRRKHYFDPALNPRILARYGKEN
jgi:hypothetical protein